MSSLQLYSYEILLRAASTYQSTLCKPGTQVTLFVTALCRTLPSVCLAPNTSSHSVICHFTLSLFGTRSPAMRGLSRLVGQDLRKALLHAFSPVLLACGSLILAVSANAGNVSAKIGPKLQFSSLLICLSKTGLMIGSSLSLVLNKQSVSSYGQLILIPDVKGRNQFSKG